MYLRRSPGNIVHKNLACPVPGDGANTSQHLAIVIDTLAGGGAEQAMLRLASTLITMGHDVKLIVIKPIVSHQVPDNIQPIFVHPAGGKRGIKFLYYRQTANALQRILDKLDQQHAIRAVLSVLPETDKITRHLQKYPVFHCIRNNIYHGLVKNRNNPFSRWSKTQKLLYIYNDSHLLFVSSGAERDMLETIGVKAKSSRVIYNPYPIEDIQTLSQAHDVEYSDYFIHVGRFNRPKRHDKLLSIYAESALDKPLLLMGEGNAEETDRIQNLIQQFNLQNKVHIIGFKKNPFPYIRNANALLLTSDHEGFPNVIAESLICGTPVIAFDCPSGPSEILDGELAEYLIPFNDQLAFIAKLKHISQNKPRIPAKIANIRKFSADKIAEQYIEAIIELADDE